jgi:transposase
MFCLLLPDMTKESFSVFNQQFCRWLKQPNQQQSVLMIADGAGAHQSRICAGCGMDLVRLPPASPELNPVERFFQELRKETANRVFATIEEVENYLSGVLQKYYQNPQTITSLTLYPYIRLPN